MRKSERAICESLVCLIRGILGRKTTVELRNENTLIGTLSNVDEHMSIDMLDCTHIDIYGRELKFERFYVKGKNIRFVHIPEDVSIINTIEKEIDTNKRKETHNERPIKPKVLSKEEKKEEKRKKIDKHVEAMKENLKKLQSKR